ncbi:MAG: rhomboid family intramembrane serine protease [Actinomycetota bacterium]|nr:rhomboid family intramembrane serine protease [Actinomycetota bacterium]
MRKLLPASGKQEQREGIGLLITIVAFMWLIEVVNTLDSNGLDDDGIYARNVSRLWGILTAPFLHVSFQHLIDNTIPFLFMGVIIALRGAAKLAIVTGIVVMIGGLGTWLIAPAQTSVGRPVVTVGASGVVFGYAAYLLARGFFDRNVVEVLIGAVVGAVWGGALISSLVPQHGISWQGHASGAVGGVVAAWLLAGQGRGAKSTAGTPPGSALDRALAN